MKLEKIISVIALATMVLIVYMTQKKTPQITPSNYESFKPIVISGYPENEVFSDEIDTIFYDELGIKNVRFKQTF
jgi:hypothetical protein